MVQVPEGGPGSCIYVPNPDQVGADRTSGTSKPLHGDSKVPAHLVDGLCWMTQLVNTYSDCGLRFPGSAR